MKIILIEPKAPGRHVYSTVTMPRLGLPILGAQLKEIGHEVKFIYESSHDILLSDIEGADIVGISATTSTAGEAYHLADIIRNKGIKVVMGGPHVSFLTEEALAHSDYVCRGEAEVSFLELVKCLEDEQIPAQVAGLSWHRDDELVHNPDAAVTELNRVPIPDLSIFDDFNKMTTYPVMTSRGCPFDCTFCSVTTMFGHKIRLRDIDLVLEELEQYAGKQVFFCDDNFTANPRRTKTLLQEMIKRKISPKWWCAQVRTDAARDEELLQLMKEAGCGMVFVGMESINPQTLQSYNKKQGVDDIEFCIKKFHQYGIMLHGMFVFGSDNDTPQTIRDTAKFALKNKIDTVQFMILTPLPGSRTYKEMEESGRLITRDWSLYDAHHVVFEPNLMLASTLQEETIRAFKKFYSLRSIGQNLFTTGWRSVLFKAAGFWLTRKWDAENAWYYKVLRKGYGSGHLEDNELTRTIKTVNWEHLKYISVKRLLDIDLFAQDGSFRLEIKGCMDRYTMKEIIRSVKKLVPCHYEKLVINVDKLSFASEIILFQFIDELNHLAQKAKKISLEISRDNKLLSKLLADYDLKIPLFDVHILGDDLPVQLEQQ